MIKEYLEYLGVRMGKDERIEFTCSRAYHPGDIHSYVCAFIGYAYLLSFLGPPASWPRVPLNAAFIEKPRVNIRIIQIDAKLLAESFSLLFVLPIWPGPRNLEAKSLLMKPSDDRAVSNIMGKLFFEIAMKLFCGPMSLVCFVGILNQLPIFHGLLFVDISGPATLWTIDKTVDALFIETSDPPIQSSSRHSENAGHLIVTYAAKKET